MKKQPQEAIQDMAMDAFSIRLTAWHARQARKIGGGELGSGVRKAIEEMVRRSKEKPAEAG